MVNVENKNQNITELMYCEFKGNNNSVSDIDIICYLETDFNKFLSYENIYVLPYTLPSYSFFYISQNSNLIPFEIIVRDIIPAEDEEEPEPSPEEEEEKGDEKEDEKEKEKESEKEEEKGDEK